MAKTQVFLIIFICCAKIQGSAQNQQLADEEICGLGWKRFENFCYKLFITGKTWIDAKHACQRRDANLVKVDSKDLRHFLSQSFTRLLNLRKSYMKPWCGLSRESGNSLDAFRWLDQSKPTVDFWALYDKTLGWPYPGNCVVLQSHGAWKTKECTHSQPYICQKGISLDLQRNNILTSNIDKANYALKGHVITSFKVPDVTECSRRCFQDSRCLSFNYEFSGLLRQNSCELNNSTRGFSGQRSFVKRPGFIYYD